MRVVVLILVLLIVSGCKKQEATRSEGPAAGKLAGQLLGKWNDKEDGSLAWEFMSEGKCRVFGNMDCQYQIASESGSVLKLRYNGLDSWDDVDLTFHDADKATWKNVTVAKSDPESAITELVRAK
jgi:hypothetical protein